MLDDLDFTRARPAAPGEIAPGSGLVRTMQLDKRIFHGRVC